MHRHRYAFAGPGGPAFTTSGGCAPGPRELAEGFLAMRGGPRHGAHRHGPGPGPGGWRGRGPGGRARRGDVRLAALLLLAEEPRNGYGLMQEIEQRSDGVWRPSPGSIYPALAQLVDEGLIREEESDGRRLYSLTDAGRREVDGRDDEARAPWEAATEGLPDGAATLLGPARQLTAAVWQVVQAGGEQEITRAREVLEDARRALYRILAEEGKGE